MKVLRIAMNGEEHPHYTIAEAFNNAFDEVKTIWWEQEPDFNNKVIQEVTANRYDAVFMQIQGDGILSNTAADAISKNSLGFNWTGDVRSDIDWYARLGKYFVTLFTNMTDVEKMRNLGYKSDYLQVGYDHKYYFQKSQQCYNNIVFCANHYNEVYPLSRFRKEIVIALKIEFGDKFNLYGGNWENCDLRSECKANNEQEAEIYRTCAIAINCSHFDYSRYSSDRLFREMASGAFVLSHRYKDIEMDFKEGLHLAAFDSIPELISKCHYYLNNHEERNVIANNGLRLVTSTAQWSNRMDEFKDIIKKYK